MKISAQLRLGACSAAVGIALIATPSFAQATSGTEDQGADATDDDTPVIVVTGSILNRENIITASPVTVISAVTLERSEEHTSELQSLMRISYAVFCLKQKNIHIQQTIMQHHDN